MCEGVTHTMAGGVAAGAVAFAATRFGVDWPPAAIGVGIFVAMGAAQLPDTDHPNSAIAHALGPVSQGICRVVSSRFRHRGPTHYLVAVPVWALLATLLARVRLDLLAPATRAAAGAWPDNDLAVGAHDLVSRFGGWQLGLFAIVALLSAWGLRLLDSDLDHALGGTGEIVAGIAIATAAFLWVPLGTWVPVAVAVGVLSHDLTDLLTRGPFRFLWPLPWRFSAGWFTTGHWAERTIVAPACLAALTALLWVLTVDPLAIQAVPVFADLAGF